MPTQTWTLVDHEKDLCIDQLTLEPAQVGGAARGYRVAVRTLRTGLSQGVSVIEVHNGDFSFIVVPTRGMGIWRARQGDMQLGWQSPRQGPVHPAFVHTNHPDGIGWLDGFDELLVRCGLESNGAPEFHADGRLRYGLHGKIANLPAHKVELEIDSDAGRIAVRGTVDEARLFGSKLRLETTIETQVGRPGLVVHDKVTNLSAAASDFELLYHINFGVPFLRPGCKVALPVKKIAPRDPVTAADVPTWNVYGPETPSSTEVCFYLEALGDAAGDSQALLHDPAAERGVSLKFNTRQLPCFSIWKNRETASDGYVTGLEPATNFPNIKSFEKQMGRVVPLQPGESKKFDLELQPLVDAAQVQSALAAIAQLQTAAAAEILRQPDPRWSISK